MPATYYTYKPVSVTVVTNQVQTVSYTHLDVYKRQAPCYSTVGRLLVRVDYDMLKKSPKGRKIYEFIKNRTVYQPAQDRCV